MTREGAAALLAGLKIWPVLQGARGRAKADVTAAIDAVVALGWLAAELGPRLAELDINPLILRVDGQGVVGEQRQAALAYAHKIVANAPLVVQLLKLIFYSWKRFAVRKLLILLGWGADFSKV